MGKTFRFFWFIGIKPRRFYLFNIMMVFILEGCNKISLNQDITYPNVISPIYYIDTFQIKYPRIAFIDSVAYIFSLDKLEPFKNKEDFINQKGVIQYLTQDMHDYRYTGYLDAIHKRGITECNSFSDLARENNFYWNELFSSCENIEDISVYRFVFEPKTFLLTIISDKYHGDLQIRPIEEMPDSCYSIPAIFSMNYSLAIMPIYNKIDLKKINALYCRYLYGENCTATTAAKTKKE